MGLIRNTDTGEVVLESPDPAAIRDRVDGLVAEWAHRDDEGQRPAPYAIEGFDSRELETGRPHPARDADTGALVLESVAPGEPVDVDGETLAPEAA